jgi:hypothetical protein
MDIDIVKEYEFNKQINQSKIYCFTIWWWLLFICKFKQINFIRKNIKIIYMLMEMYGLLALLLIVDQFGLVLLSLVKKFERN